jgi:hypothetical protein
LPPQYSNYYHETSRQLDLCDSVLFERSCNVRNQGENQTAERWEGRE